MANQWLRLWHDMPNDPKWTVIAEKSEQPVHLVIAVYVHMLVNASTSPRRGHLHHWCDEDIAAALRTQPNAIERIRTHMSGKVLTGDGLIGWDRRQPLREDDSAERAKIWRENKKEESERNRTKPNANEHRLDKEEDKKKEEKKGSITKPNKPTTDLVNGEVQERFAKARAPVSSRGTRLRPDWVLPMEWGKWALDLGMSKEDILREADKFRDYWTAKSGAMATKVDWEATWRNWIRNHLENGR